MTIAYDLHLAAFRIRKESVRSLENLGFLRDAFANNTRCVASEYHATFRKQPWLADHNQWDEICSILLADNEFCGCLEEEALEPGFTCEIRGIGPNGHSQLPPIRFVEVPAGEHKACDLHISTSLTRSTPFALRVVESLELACFDKPTQNDLRRVHTVTCETREDGEQLFRLLRRFLNLVPGLRGKMKLEFTSRYLRHPGDAPTLPITPQDMVADWCQLATEMSNG